jgi:protein SCO1/2
MTFTRPMAVLWGVLSLVVAIAIGTGAWMLWGQDDAYQFNGGFWEPTSKAPPLDLTDQNGQPFTLSAQEGKVVLLYFGYTYCPDYCPTTLAEMQTVESLLGDNADRVEVVMVSVDPERDTPARLNEYLSFFDPSFIGLSADAETTDRVKRDYGVLATRQDVGGASGYLVDHSTSLLAIDPGGYLRLTWAYGTDPALIVEDVEHLLGA